MDPKLLKYYNRELQHVREIGAEFAAEFPKIASRLGLDTFECSDPYVERLFEGFAFMAARVQLKVDAEFPNFTQQLLQIVYPHCLANTPSMTVVEFKPDLTDENLAKGIVIPKGSSLRSQVAKTEQTPCEYRTGQNLQLLPIEITRLDYLPTRVAVANAGITSNQYLAKTSAALRVVLRSTAGVGFKAIALDKLPVFLRGTGGTPYRLYEQILANATALAVKFNKDGHSIIQFGAGKMFRAMGFDYEEALLQHDLRSFDGYRILQEYFAFPERYLFVELNNLKALTADCDSTELELFILLNRADAQLTDSLDKSNMALFCSPAINLFPKRADRIRIDHRQAEYHLVVDRSRPCDFEVYSLNNVMGYPEGQSYEQRFLPFYGSKNAYQNGQELAFYTLRRHKRMLSSKQRREGVRSSYIGSEIFIALVDAAQAPFAKDLVQLGVETWCTNRDLPLTMPVGIGNTDFSLQISAPVKAIRCVAGPTRPLPAAYEGETVWKLINHLSLNYLSLLDSQANEGAAALRELLSLYAEQREPAIKKQIDGVVSISAKNIVRRIDAKGPMVFGRGLEISVLLDEAAFEGGGYFLMGTVLEQFFARYVSINSFVETHIKTTDRGVVAKWPVRMGCRHTI
ncbi:MAG: type VI secretion system baseplate subunit TssF [Methylococcaceae bacterium]|jgi:type VI secretion system protein ImpG